MNGLTENKGFIYEFGKFVLDPQERILLADGSPVHLADKIFDTLLLLIENNGRLLTKDEMMTSIWEETFVEEGNLAKNVSRLRKILNADGIELIETLPKRGYRFLADIKRLDGETNLLVHRRVRVKITQTDTESTNGAGVGGSLGEVHSIAVLPFQPLGLKSDEDFFGLGLTDALITQLSRTGQIAVRPTSAIIKYNSPEHDAVSTGRDLQVDAVLEGKFQRLGSKLRLTVQMLHTETKSSLWAESFNAEVEDIFAIQDSIAERVADALSLKLTDEARIKLKKRHTENVEAYQEYLKGRFFWNKRTVDGFTKALTFFERAIEIDPLFALAYTGIADIYNQLPIFDDYTPHDFFPKAKAAALRALELDESLAEAHASLGFVLLNYDWNWSGAEVAFQRAIKLNPTYALAHHWFGTLLLRAGRTGEAILAAKEAQQLDPLSPVITTWLAEAMNVFGDREAAIALHRQTLIMSPDCFYAYFHLALIYADCQRHDEAREAAQTALRLSKEISMTLSLTAVLQAVVGEKSIAVEILDQLLKIRTTKYISAVNIAGVYAVLGDENETLDWLEKAFVERDPFLTWLGVDKEFVFLRNNPRFQTLRQKIGL